MTPAPTDGASPVPEEVASVLEFWFDPRQRSRWFASDPQLDEELRSRFGRLREQAAQGRLDDWRQWTEGVLALILLLDQFSRNLFRGDAEAFRTDPQARALARDIIGTPREAELSAEQRAFLYMPLMHSEELTDQDQSVALFAALGQAASHDYARRHREVILRFGRFPRRNAALGRNSTPEELAFLREGGADF